MECFVADNLQQAHLAMKNAYDLITKQKENDEKKQREIDRRCTQAREKVQTLKKMITDRDRTIEELQNMQVGLLLVIIIIMSSAYTIQPIAVDNLGGFSTSTTSFLSELGRQLSSVSNDPNETLYSFQRISVALQRFNSVLLYDSLLDSIPDQ